jgi:peptide chain release factor 1
MSETVIVELRAAEGGDDAKLLVREQLGIYAKYAARRSLCMEAIDVRPGFIVFRVYGQGAIEAFKNEGGGMRWQRVPPNEKRGRVHTSTVTVAVLPEPTAVQVRLDDRDLEYRTCRASGAGGQKVNKTDSAVQLTHKPTGLMVRVETERSQHQNRATALALLRARLWQGERDRAAAARDEERREQVGSGMRGDKRRTIAVQRGTVVDHVTGRSWRFEDYLRGNW